MKLKILITALALCLLTMSAPKADDIVFGGLSYESGLSGFAGIGHTMGRVSIWPYGSVSMDSTLEGGLRLTKSAGVETIIWLYQKPKLKGGLIGSAFNLDWIDNQEKSIGAYWSQSIGFAVNWQAFDEVAVTLIVKEKFQPFSGDTLYPDDLTFALSISTKKFW